MPLINASISGVKELFGRLSGWARGVSSRMAFHARERRRYNIRTPLRWASQAQLIEADIGDHVDVEGRSVLDDGFVERMADAREKVASTAAKYSYASYAVTAYFLLAILAVDLDISAFGVTLKRVAGLNELLLIGSAFTGALGTWHRVRVITLDAAIKTAINIQHQGPIRYVYGAAFLPSEHVAVFTPNYSPHLIWSPWKQRFVMYTSIVAVIFIFGALAAITGFRLYTAYWVWSSPSTENTILRLGILVAPLLDLVTVAYGMMYFLPLPHRDYFLDNKVMWLEDRYPDDATKLREHLYGESVTDRMKMEEAGHLPPYQKPQTKPR